MFFISQKILVSGQTGNLVPFWAKSAQFDISVFTWKIFLKLCSITWYYKRTKIICLKFLQKYLLGQNGQFGHDLGKNYTIYYFRIHCKDFLKLCNMSSYYNRKKNYFPKNSCFGTIRQFGPILGQNCAIWYLRIPLKDFFFKLCSTLRHSVGLVPHLLHVGVSSFF